MATTAAERAFIAEFEAVARPMRLAGVGQPCPRCGVTMTPSGRTGASGVTVDHIVPRRLGGTNEPGNCRCMCRRCNSLLGASLGGRIIAARGGRRRPRVRPFQAALSPTSRVW